MLRGNGNWKHFISSKGYVIISIDILHTAANSLNFHPSVKEEAIALIQLELILAAQGM